MMAIYSPTEDQRNEMIDFNQFVTKYYHYIRKNSNTPAAANLRSVEQCIFFAILIDDIVVPVPVAPVLSFASSQSTV